ncbi:MAG TPA: glycosyltransferase family 2 protein, partial [Actinomycetota bacterium]|nr:glycosyltransferase family 2 protein [Actinomycetota bacterium]
MQEPTPSVLAILVVKDGAQWIQRALSSLARQTYPRLGVLAVDDASTDGSGQTLERMLGPRRVLRLRRSVGFAAAVSRAVDLPAARDAEYLLLIHDDVALAPEAVTRLVETARRLDGVGVVGPKVVDWERPEVLLDIGSATDRFGYPYSPLEEDEIDQGQYDAIREVLYVSSAAALVRREAWVRAGLPDDRLRWGTGELDFCWRVRLAGFRVLVDPGAVALHRLAGRRAERADGQPPANRYLTERIGLLSVLKNYRLLTLLWLLPLYAVQGTARAMIYLLTRHIDRTWDVVRAWGWNLGHLPGTVRRRFRAQRSRRVPDREVARFMAPAGARLQRWFLQASALLVARHERAPGDEEEPEAPPLRRRVAGLAASHPAAVGIAFGALLTLLAFREVLFGPRLEGGMLPAFPAAPWGMFREFGAGWTSTGFGGPGGASPALVALGAGSVLTLANPDLLARLLVALTPFLAGVAAYRALRPLNRDAAASAIGAACYALSAITLWAASEGTVATSILLWTLPWLAVRLSAAFDAKRGGGRWVVGTAVVLAFTGSFFPAVWLALAVLVAPMFLVPARGGSRTRGVAAGLAATAAAGALVFPFAMHLFAAGGGTQVEAVGRPEFAALLRLSPGPAPGSWLPAVFLPVAAVLSFPFVARPRAGWATRALVSAGAAVVLAWLAAAGHLPDVLANPVAYLAGAAFALAAVVALAMPSVVPTIRRSAFGAMQVTVGALVAVLAAGLGLQVVQAALGGWAVGPARVPPAWPVVATADPGTPFRVLWLGSRDGSPFPAPGGAPQGTIESGGTAVAYAVTGRGGRSVLGIGIPAEGPGHEALGRSVGAILSGRLRHGGAALAPMAIRYVVVTPGRLPDATTDRLEDQVDLLPIQRAGGLTIYRNAAALPVAAAVAGEQAVSAARSGSVLAAARLRAADLAALEPAEGPGWRGSVPERRAGLVAVASQVDGDWRLRTADGQEVAPFPAFGWALGFEGPEGATSVRVAFGG